MLAILCFTLLLSAVPTAANAVGAGQNEGYFAGTVSIEGPGNGPDGWQRYDNADDPALSRPARSMEQSVTGQRDAVASASRSSARAQSEAVALNSYDYYTLDQCREQYDLDGAKHKYRNHFASCLRTSATYIYWWCTPRGCGEVGRTEFRYTMIGYGNRSTRAISYVAELDQPKHRGETHFEMRMRVDLECVPLPGADCGSDPVAGAYKTLGEWIANGRVATAEFDTSASPGSGQSDPYHNPLDKVSYHEMQTTFSNPEIPAMPVTRNSAPFRCDAAVYASGGGCIFSTIDAVHHVSLRPEDGISEEAAHVLAAQKAPETTKPGAFGKSIPGDPDGQFRKPLTRMYPGYESD